MAEKGTGATKLTAVELIRETLGTAKLRQDELELLTVAVEQDRLASAARETDAHLRLARVEIQTQLLADAVIAIARTDTSIESAVQAVKDTLDRRVATDKPRDER